ncbi:MAG: hypothetical protein RLZZ444_189 [Pseudomonadota bacterium]|jgi:beta-phosphoglucomutase-like phosphatase (HAD superfamily)
MAHPKIVAILDIDGTLLDSSDHHQAAAKHAMKTFSVDPNSRPLSSFRNFTDGGVLDELLLDLRGFAATDGERSAFEAELGAHFDQLSSNTLTEIAGAQALLEALFAHADVQPIFATGSCRPAAISKLRHFGLRPANVIIHTGTEFRRREDIIVAGLSDAAALLGTRDIAAVSIGDGLWDEATAETLYLPFIGVGGDPSRFRRAETRAIPDLRHLTASDIIAASRPFRWTENA